MENPEIALFWHAISRTLDRIIACLDGLDEEGLNWRPPAEGANSLYALATHMLANAEENLLGVLCDQPVARDREAEFVARDAAAEPLRAHWRDLQGARESLPGGAACVGAGPCLRPPTPRLNRWPRSAAGRRPPRRRAPGPRRADPRPATGGAADRMIRDLAFNFDGPILEIKGRGFRLVVP
jgi:hypothetical protein